MLSVGRQPKMVNGVLRLVIRCSSVYNSIPPRPVRNVSSEKKTINPPINSQARYISCHPIPDVKITTSLMYGVVEKGKVVLRKTLAAGGEGLSGIIPGYARFHVTPDGRLFVFYYHSGKDADDKRISENRIMEILPDGGIGKDVRVELKHPFTSFMTTTVRGGSPPSDVLEVLGVASGRAGISYARIALFGDK